MGVKKTAEQKKAEVPVTRDEFKTHSKPLEIKIGDQVVVALPREFDVQKGKQFGSFGWRTNDKVWVTFRFPDGREEKLRVQLGCNFMVINSNEVP